ncbi:MAG: phosphoethanolamine transferase [Butyrivibrio sp.]|nr:phosphoethanolamine transferase [Butyrivibrio sp.]
MHIGKMKTIINNIINIIKDNSIFILVMLIANSTTAFCYLLPFELINVGSTIRFIGYELLLCFTVIVLTLILTILSAYLKAFVSVIKNVLCIVSIVLFGIDIFLLIKFKSILDQAKIEIILGTNPYTVYEFFKMYIMSFPAFLAVILLCVLIYGVKKIGLKYRFNNRAAWLMLLCTVLGGIVFCINVYRTGMFGLLEKNIYRGLLLNRVLIDMRAAINSLGNENDIDLAFNTNPEEIIENNSETPYVVFILGESVDRNKMSAYGYKKQTTPFLDELIKNKEAFLFNDVIAPANYTSMAMEKIFTFSTKNDKKHWYEYQNLIDIVKMANYRTVWLSNQSPVGKYGNTDRILANRCDEYQFTSVEGGGTGTLTRPLDSALLPLLDESLTNSRGKNFYVLHIEGSHEVFAMRYPESFNKFNADNYDGENYEWNKAKAEYDNTILYTDFIISQIIERFKNKNAVIIYISDHGNEVYDGRDFVGHSGENERNNHMVEIPMFIYGTSEFWEKNKDLKIDIELATSKPYMTDNIIHMILDVMKIKSTSYSPEKSIINKKFIPVKRMYGGQKYERRTEDD